MPVLYVTLRRPDYSSFNAFADIIMQSGLSLRDSKSKPLIFWSSITKIVNLKLTVFFTTSLRRGGISNLHY